MTDNEITSQDAAMANLVKASDPIVDLIEAKERTDPAAELAAYKRKVAEVMTRYATRHNLCNVADAALAEVGLRRVEGPSVRYTATLVIGWTENGLADRGDRGIANALNRVTRELVDFDGDVDGVLDCFEGSTFDGRSDITIESLTSTATAGEVDPTAHLLPARDGDGVAF